MIGQIINIEDNTVFVKLNLNLNKMPSIINLHVVFDDSQRKLVGEIAGIKENIANINLIGEIFDNKFLFGVSKKPSFNANVNFVTKQQLDIILGMDNYDEKKHLYLGKSPLYEGVNIGVNINNFFSNHFAIFGSTGSGKSCSVSRLFQNLFEKQKMVAYNASILIFDAYGEYHNAFKDLNAKTPQINFKSYTTNVNDNSIPKIKIPLWLLTVDDIALLLEVKSANELPIIEKALKLVTIFTKEESQVLKSKNDIIARALLDILTSGNEPAQIRDQIFSILSHYNTKDLNLETEIYQPGYTRPLKQCLAIDNTGKIRDIELITTFINGFLANDIELSLPDGTFKYTLNDLYNAFEFALISEGVFVSDKIFDDYNIIKVRLRSLMNSDYSKYFDINEYQTKDSFINEILTTTENKRAQLINFNINYVDDRFAKTITKVYSRIFFEYVKNLPYRASLPIHIVLEEAHRYVQNDTDINIIGYNIFDRITKEGRKYGIMLGLISQRPCELSNTALSQCSNFLIFKILHPTDIEYIKEMVPNITNEIINKIKLLQPGTCIGFGSSFKLPSLITFDMPNPLPSSNSCDISNIWFVDK